MHHNLFSKRFKDANGCYKMKYFYIQDKKGINKL